MSLTLFVLLIGIICKIFSPNKVFEYIIFRFLYICYASPRRRQTALIPHVLWPLLPCWTTRQSAPRSSLTSWQVPAIKPHLDLTAIVKVILGVAWGGMCRHGYVRMWRLATALARLLRRQRERETTYDEIEIDRVPTNEYLRDRDRYSTYERVPTTRNR